MYELLTNLVDRGKNDITNFATGGFAGRVYGQVSISNCEVSNLSISNNKDITGGFVGNIEGMTQYDGLSGLLGGITIILENLLNIIPFVLIAFLIGIVNKEIILGLNLGFAIFIIDFIVTTLILWYYEKKSLNIVLKGE